MGKEMRHSGILYLISNGGFYFMRKLAHSVSSLQLALQPQTEIALAVHLLEELYTQLSAVQVTSSAWLGLLHPQELDAPLFSSNDAQQVWSQPQAQGPSTLISGRQQQVFAVIRAAFNITL